MSTDGVRGERPRRIGILSASVGAGHDGAAHELARRLRERGFRVDCHDFLTLLPGRSGPLARGTYEQVLHRMPWMYGLSYALTAAVPATGSVARASLRSTRSRLLRLVPPETAAVVSTYPLANQALGMLRREGHLRAPVVAYLADFAVHPMWVAPGVDVHCALHEDGAAQARRAGAAAVHVGGPAVPPRFGPASPAARRRARERFGLPARGRLALLSAGSWGVGGVRAAAMDILQSNLVVPVVACGRNAALHDRLRRDGLPHVLGWVSDMPALLAAVDVVVENAGGLTALEAMASAVPVLTYRPLAGHGRANAAALARAGVASWARRPGDLRPCLRALLEGDRGAAQRRAGLALFATDPADVVAAAAARRPG